MQEAGIISQAIDHFTVKTNQAKLPDIKEESETEKEQNQEKPVMLSQ